MRVFHDMPFGAQVLPGGVRFRLWAPAAKEVELSLEDEGLCLPMEKGEGGWFERFTDRAGPGSLYYFRIDGGMKVPDPASRFQPRDVHGPSQVVDPGAFDWDEGWEGRPWEEAVIYELHVGAFSPEGTFQGVKARLDALLELGVTAIELMPLADFPGKRNWGYDGALPFAPDGAYGTPEDLKELIQAAHRKGIMVFLDVVYNHFGPEGNYLHLYAPHFFTERHHTPWGAAIDFSHRTVRDFFIHNALYWLEEYRFDGLRLDAVHAIFDDACPDILEELAFEVEKALPGRHLVLENDNNAAHYLEEGFRAQWNDDIHHALHVLVSGETQGYYMDYADDPIRHVGRCLAEGFAYQGEFSAYRKRPRGESSRHLPSTAFVAFLQNHDQIGNRAFGERLTELAPGGRVRAAAAALLLAPSPPLIFMGEEWAASTPFLFFCDFGEELAQSVTEGRRKEFAHFPAFHGKVIPDPNDAATFEASKLRWEEREEAFHRDFLDFYRGLLQLRRKEIAPRLPARHGAWEKLGERGMQVTWRMGDKSRLTLLANLGEMPLEVDPPKGRCLYRSDEAMPPLPPWSVALFVHES